MRVLGYSRALADTQALGTEEADGKIHSDTGEELAIVGTSSLIRDGGFSAGAESGPAGAGGSVVRSSGSSLAGPGAEAAATRLVADRLFELTIKFVGTVGVSILRFRGQNAPFSLLAPSFGALFSGIVTDGDNGPGSAGRVGKPNSLQRRAVYGSFELENVTKALPLEYRVAGRDRDNNIVCEEMKGKVEAGILARLQNLTKGSVELILLAEGTGTLPPASRRRLRFCVLFHAFQGVFQREIIVENLSSPGLKIGTSAGAAAATSLALSYAVRLFVDDGSVGLNTLRLMNNSAATTLLVSQPRSSSKSPINVTQTSVILVHETTAQHQERLADENGNSLPSLETLALPFVVNVAPSVAACSPSAHEGYPTDALVSTVAGVTTMKDQTRKKGGIPNLTRFRILAVMTENVEANASSTYDNFDKMHDIEEFEGSRSANDNGSEETHAHQRRDRSGEKWGGKLSTAGDNALRAGLADNNQCPENEERGGVVIHLTNVLDRTVFLAPYSNLPLIVKAVAGEGWSTGRGEASARLYECESSDFLKEDGRRKFESLEIDGELAVTNKSATAARQGVLTEGVQEEVNPGSLARCGPALTLAPKGTVTMRLSIRTGDLTESLPTASVESGQAVPFDGMVALARIGDASPMMQGAREIEHGERLIEKMTFPKRVDCAGVNIFSRTATDPRLVKLVRVVGTYCRPRFEVVGPIVVDLGNVGHTASKRGQRRFEVRLRNLCDTSLAVRILGLSPELELISEGDGRGSTRGDKAVATQPDLGHRRGRKNDSVSSINGEALTARGHGSVGWPRKTMAGERHASKVWIPARGEATLVFQLRLSRRKQSWAGPQTFEMRLVNMVDPSAEDFRVTVLARVVTQLVSIIGLDEAPPSPTLARLLSPGIPNLSASSIFRRSRSSSLDGFGSFGTNEGGSVRLAPPLAIPPLRGAAGRCSGSFQVKNVSGERVSVTLRVVPAPEVARVLSLGASLQQQDSSAGVYASAGADGRPSPSVALLPGDLLDVQTECLAQPGARLSPDLLQITSHTADVAPITLPQGGAKEARSDWAQNVRLVGTVLVEIALEDNAGDPDGLADGGSAEGEGVLIESVALVGSLVPGPTFGLSRTSVTVALRPPDSGGGGGGGHSDGTHPYNPEGPASFFVESCFSKSLGPVRFKLSGGGRLHLARGVRVPAAEDEGGGRRRPARVVKVVTVVAEPSRGTVSANGRREVFVKLIAAEKEEDDGLGAESGGVGGGGREQRHESGAMKVQENAVTTWGSSFGDDIGEEQNQCGLFVSIMDAGHPGYPPQVVMVHVEVPAVISECEDPWAGALGFGAFGSAGGIGDGPAGMLAVSETPPRGSYGFSSQDTADALARMSPDGSSGQTISLPMSR